MTLYRLRLLLAATALLGLAALAVAQPTAPSAPAAPTATASATLDPARTVRVDYLDVGQGDAMLLRSYTGKTVLIDTGGPKARGKLKRALKAEGVTRIDALVLTHPHADHIGNAVAVLKAFEVGIVYEPGYPHTSATYRKLLETIQEKGIRYKKARAGMRLKLADDVELLVLAPGEDWVHSDRSVLNCTSVVTRLTYGAHRFLFTGDIEEEVERDLLERHPDDLPADVLKVAHHGSKHTSREAFLDKVKPSIAVIEVGKGNSYGHPHRQVMSRLKDRGIRTYTTEVHGRVTVSTDGKTVQVRTEKDLPPF
jgi:competence protein ComEC